MNDENRTHRCGRTTQQKEMGSYGYTKKGIQM